MKNIDDKDRVRRADDLIEEQILLKLWNRKSPDPIQRLSRKVAQAAALRQTFEA